MPATYAFPHSSFKAYDIRGIVPSALNPDFAKDLGRGLAARAKAAGVTTMVVGRDGRISSPSLAAALQQGMRDGGINTIDVGEVPTPLVYFAAYTLKTGSGVAVTGSHNPPDYNGCKMMMGKKSFFGADSQTLGAMAAKGDWESGQGKAEKKDILAAYAARLLKDVKPGKKLKVAWDTGNGAVGVSIRAVVDKLEGEHFVLNEKVDGTWYIKATKLTRLRVDFSKPASA